MEPGAAAAVVQALTRPLMSQDEQGKEQALEKRQVLHLRASLIQKYKY